MEYIIGCYTDNSAGIDRIERTGAGLTVVKEAPSCENTTYLAFDRTGRYIYTGNELERKDGGMSIICLNADTLETVCECDAGGSGPCHFALYKDILFTSAYDAGRIALYRAENGKAAPLCVFDHNTAEKASHAHCALPDEKRGLVHTVDLGLGAIVTYEVRDDGTVAEYSRSLLPSGCGPRHIVRLGGDDYAVACELSSELLLLRWNGNVFELLDRVSTLPADAGESYAGAIKTHDGRIYVSNRGHNSIAVFGVEDDRLVSQGFIDACVDFPRDFTVCEDGALLIAGQRSNDIVLLTEKDGAYTLGCRLEMHAPVCIVPVPEGVQ